MAPAYFAGQVRFGDITQVSFTFQRIESALSFVVDNLAALSGLAAQTERLDELLRALVPRGDPGASVARGAARAGAVLELEGLSLWTPGGAQHLADGLDLSLGAGQSLLVMGPSGCGKSSLLRCIAGEVLKGLGDVAAACVQGGMYGRAREWGTCSEHATAALRPGRGRPSAFLDEQAGQHGRWVHETLEIQAAHSLLVSQYTC